MDSYILEYNATVRGCVDIPPTQGGPIIINSTLRMFELTDLEEDSDIAGTITAVNIRGRSSSTFSTMTLSARNLELARQYYSETSTHV